MSLQRAQEITADAMNRIKSLFKPGVKITVAVRTPGFPERDFLMTDDDPAEVIELIKRRVGEGQSSHADDCGHAGHGGVS